MSATLWEAWLLCWGVQVRSGQKTGIWECISSKEEEGIRDWTERWGNTIILSLLEKWFHTFVGIVLKSIF